MAYIPPGWDDLRFPAQAINPAGAAAPPSVDATTAYPGSLLFDSAVNNHVAGIAQMPHAWERGTAIYPHIHWAKTTADAGGAAVTWEFKYRIFPVGEVATNWSDWIAGTLAVGDLTTLEKQNLSSFGAIDMTGYKESTCVIWELRRNTTDTYGSNARLLELDFHYLVEKQGTYSQIPS